MRNKNEWLVPGDEDPPENPPGSPPPKDGNHD